MRKRKISAILAMALAASMVLAGCSGSDFTLASENVTLELGDELSTNAADYVKFKDNVSQEKQEEILADTTVDLSGVDQDAIGEYEAMVIYDGKNLSFTVQVQDTEAPAASLVNDVAEVSTGVEVAAADLVTDIVDAQDVTVQFVTSSAVPAEFDIPDGETAGDTEAAEGEETDAADVENAEAVEAEVPDESAQADGEDAAEAESPDTADATDVGSEAEAADSEAADDESTDVEAADGAEDGAAPVEGDASTTEAVIGEEVADTYTFQAAGKYEITIRLTDASGNSTDLVQKVNVTDPDATAPVIEGVDDITVYLDNEPDYLDGVTASDDVDGDLTSAIVVDSSAVDVSTVGTYTATYSVKDAAGNETVETITVSVVRKPQAPAKTTTPTAGTTPQASTDNGNSGGGSSSGGSSSGGSSSGGSSSGGGSSTPAPSNPAPTTPSTDGNNSGSVSSGDSGSTDSGSDSTWSEGEAVTGDNFADWATQNGADNSQSGDHANNTGDEIGFY